MHRLPFVLALLCAGAVGVLLLRPAAPVEAQPMPRKEPAPPEPRSELDIVAEVNASIDRGLEYLASKQRLDGSWEFNQAVNALALLAFMGRGNVPGRGKYVDVLERGRTYLTASANKQNGYIAIGSMYEHGLATLALAELYGHDDDPELERTLRKAIQLIENSQSPAGGWRYNPDRSSQDVSVTVMQVVALRAAQNAEIPVRQDVIDKAAAYIRRCAHPNGGFGYEGPAQGPQTSAAGVLSLQLLGHYDDPSIPKTMEYLRQYLRPDAEQMWSNSGVQYFWYFHYYAMQCHYQAGGKYWNDWHPLVRSSLLRKQNADGSWDVPPGTAEVESTVGKNKIYWTAMACLTLDIYLHFLPAYQR